MTRTQFIDDSFNITTSNEISNEKSQKRQKQSNEFDEVDESSTKFTSYDSTFFYHFITRFSTKLVDETTIMKFQTYMKKRKRYDEWQTMQRKETNMKNNIKMKILLRKVVASKNFIVSTKISTSRDLKKVTIKVCDNISKKYEENNYIKYDNYVVVMKNQFQLNNVSKRDDLDNVKIAFVTIFLNITSRYEWQAHVREMKFNNNWTNFCKFLTLRFKNSTTFMQNIYEKW